MNEEHKTTEMKNVFNSSSIDFMAKESVNMILD